MQSQSNSQPLKSRNPRSRRRVFITLALVIGLFIGVVSVEVVCRIILNNEKSKEINEGTALASEADDRWGWRLKQGKYRCRNSEFDVTGFVNRLYMNDGMEYDAEADANKTRVLVLGDSHTAAIGAGANEVWVRVLEDKLNKTYGPGQFRCYNVSAPGYSLHQYLTRLIDQGPELKPHYVVVGLSYATDFYDLLPPERGGWIYGGDFSRIYYDFDSDKRLIERHWKKPTTGTVASAANESSEQKATPAKSLRNFLGHFATFNYFRRSNLALKIGSKFKMGGQSLWPNMEVILRKDLDEGFQYQWDLAKALLGEINEEAGKLNAQLIIVGIPYLPQVYDEIWNSCFGGDDAYDRTIAIQRISDWCDDNQILNTDTLQSFRAAVEEKGHWVHHRRDAHPTSEGHEVIADSVVDSELIRPTR